MASQLKVAIGQCSYRGHKAINQDFHGACIPAEPLLNSKGVAIAIADGISTSEVSHIASETAVRALLEDYYCTADAWSVKRSVQQVLMATNSWLHAQSRHHPHHFDRDRGYVCTLSAVVIKSTTAHLFHIGDARIYQLQGQSLTQLTEDHRLWVAADTSYLSRALGAQARVEIDYLALDLQEGDSFLLATDGVYEYIDANAMVSAMLRHHGDLDAAAQTIVEQALQHGSEDNLTVQILRIEQLPAQDADEIHERATHLPLPPVLQARMRFDGYEIIRPLHIGARSHVFMALEPETHTPVALKVPASEIQDDPAALERFAMEEWIARRIDHPHVLKSRPRTHAPHYLYGVMEYIDGQTLTQWLVDHPKPELAEVRDIIEQIGQGLRAFHRQEMIHQDLRPDNILIDRQGTVKIIDFGSVSVAGVAESQVQGERGAMLGTTQYAAPEYFLGEVGTAHSDIFSLGVIAYQMLTGDLPYGTEVAQLSNAKARRRLRYRPVYDYDRGLPTWINGVLRKAVHPDPQKRHRDVDEFLYDLRRPQREFLREMRPPLIQRNPVRFWQSVSLILTLMLIALLAAAHLS